MVNRIVCILFLFSPCALLLYGQPETNTRYEDLPVISKESFVCQGTTLTIEMDFVIENTQSKSFYYYYFDTPAIQIQTIRDTIHLYQSLGQYDCQYTKYLKYSPIRKNYRVMSLMYNNVSAIGNNGWVGEDLQSLEIPASSVLMIHLEQEMTHIDRARKKTIGLQLDTYYFWEKDADIESDLKNSRYSNIIYCPFAREVYYETKLRLRSKKGCD